MNKNVKQINEESRAKALSAVEQIELQKKVEELQAMIAQKDEVLEEVANSGLLNGNYTIHDRVSTIVYNSLAATSEDAEAWRQKIRTEAKIEVLEEAETLIADNLGPDGFKAFHLVRELRKNGVK